MCVVWWVGERANVAPQVAGALLQQAQDHSLLVVLVELVASLSRRNLTVRGFVLEPPALRGVGPWRCTRIGQSM